jgi:hypothetical protein
MPGFDSTIIAALIGAGMIFASFWATQWTAGRTAKHAAHRELLAPHVAAVGVALHQCVATSKIFARRIALGQSPDVWRARGQKAHKDLERLRLRVKYTLWALDEALRTLSRVPDWIGHAAADSPERADRLVEAADALRAEVDARIRKSIQTGVPPTGQSLAPLIMAVNRAFDDGARGVRVAEPGAEAARFMLAEEEGERRKKP